MSVATEQEEVVAELRGADKLLLTTHENPDGDALGSLLAMHCDPRAARQGLADVHVAGRVPAAVGVPAAGPSSGLVGAPPDDVAERTIVFLDCGNIDRMPVDFLQADGLHILNIDHHHDNTRFGTVNLVVPDGLVHRRDRLAARQGAGRRDHAARSPTRSTWGS